MAGYNGLGIHKKIVASGGGIANIEEDLNPKLGGDLDGNEKMITNIPWLQTMNIGANEVLIGQGDMSAEDYGYSGLSFQHPLGGYFNIGTNEIDGEKVLYFSPPSSYGFFVYGRDQRLDKTIAQIDASALKHLVSKEWVLSKIQSDAKQYLIEDRLIIPANTSSINTFYKLNGLGDEITVLDYANPTTNWQNIQRSALMRADQILNAYASITTGYMSIISKDYRTAVGEVTLNVYVGDTITKYLVVSQTVNFGINYYKIPLDLTGFGGKLYYNRNYIFYEIVYSQNVGSKTEMKIQLSFE